MAYQLVGVHVLVLIMGCLVAVVHGWFVGAFVCAMIFVVQGNAKPVLLSPCHTHLCRCNIHVYPCSLNTYRLAFVHAHTFVKEMQQPAASYTLLSHTQNCDVVNNNPGVYGTTNSHRVGGTSHISCHGLCKKQSSLGRSLKAHIYKKLLSASRLAQTVRTVSLVTTSDSGNV